MTRIRNVGGKIIETTGGKDISYAKEDIVFNSSKKIMFTSDNGVTFGKPESPPKKVSKTRVKEVELITALDDGSANDGTTGLQKGFIFGNTYKFKIKSFSNGEPISKTLIKWMYKYHNFSTVLTPIKQEYYSKFRLLIMRLIFPLKLDLYLGSIFPLV